MPTVSVKKKNPNGTISTENEVELVCDTGTSLWTALEAKGHKLPLGCSKGLCGACRVEVISGAESLAAPGANETETLNLILKNKDPQSLQGKTIRLSCQAQLTGNANLEIVPFD